MMHCELAAILQRQPGRLTDSSFPGLPKRRGGEGVMYENY